MGRSGACLHWWTEAEPLVNEEEKNQEKNTCDEGNYTPGWFFRGKDLYRKQRQNRRTVEEEFEGGKKAGIANMMFIHCSGIG